MVLQLALAAGGAAATFFGANSARKAAKKTQKLQIEADQFAKKHNTAEIKFRNKQRLKLAKEIKNTKEVTTEETRGTNTRSHTMSSSTSNSFDAEAMMKAAEASGINPITFLRNGGMAAFIRTQSDQRSDESETFGTTVTTTRKGHNAVAAANMALRDLDIHGATPISHVPGAGEGAGAAVAQFANAAGDIASRQQAQDFAAQQALNHQGFQRELMNMSLGGVQRGGAIPGGRSFYTPGFSTSGPTVTRQTQGGLSSGPVAPTAGDVTVTNPHRDMHVDPTRRDATAWGDRYGEVGEWLSGPINFFHDGLYNINRYRDTPQHRQDRQVVKDWLSENVADRSTVQGFKDWFGGLRWKPGAGMPVLPW